MDKPTVRLESGATGTKRKKAATPSDQNVKLAIRLIDAVNEALRGLIRYRGDLSAMAIDALTSLDLESAGLTHYKTMEAASPARKLKALEEENRKLKKLLAESMLDVSTLKEMLGKNF